MTTRTVTTIKVSTALRDRLARDAAREGQSAAGLIAALLDEFDRRRRFDAVRQAYAGAEEAYLEEDEVWDGLAGDGLSRD